MSRELTEVVISDIRYDRYECKGISEAGTTVYFRVPASTYGKILEHPGADRLKETVRWLFETKYELLAGSECSDLGTLDRREVDGLFCDIRRKKRRKSGGWTRAADGIGPA